MGNNVEPEGAGRNAVEGGLVGASRTMKCVICRHRETVAGDCTATLDRNGSTVVFVDVPGQVCENGGEQYVSAETTSRLLDEADQAVRNGVEVEARNFAVV